MNSIHSIKAIICLLFLSTTIWVVYINYEPPVSGFVKQIEKGVLNLKHTVKIVDEADTKHSSPYFYSTYSPEDELYEPVLAIQQERAYDAVDKLEELAAKNNADALYWLAIITYKSSAFSGQTGAELFERSAELGNPYAALMLDENNYECKTSMPSHCDKKWGELAKKLLIEREKNGDLEASYSLIPQLNKAPKQDHEKLDKLAYEGFNQGYLVPLYNLVFIYQTFDSDSDPDSVYLLTEEERAILNQLVLIMANRHHLTSVYTVINNENKTFSEKDIQIVVNNNLYTMGNSYPLVLYYLMDKKNSNRQEQILWASISKVADTYQNSMSRNRYFKFHNNSIKEHSHEFSDKELERIEQLTIENLSKSTPNIYITMGCPQRLESCLRVNE